MLCSLSTKRREHRELLQLVLHRGFTTGLLTKLYIARIKNAPRGERLTLQQFFRAINRGEFDYMLTDKSGRSYS